MTLDFYYVPGSAPCRIVMLTAKALGVDLNLKLVNLQEGEQLKPEYLKMNPQHTVPTLDDNGFYLWESRAIATYLANKYGKDDSLYPKDPQRRAVIDRLLYFDGCTLYSSFAAYAYPQVFGGAPPNPEKLADLKKSLTYVETFLGDKKYLTGDQMTLADLSLVASISTFELIDLKLDDWPKVSAWLGRLKGLPYYKEANQDGIDMFKAFMKSKK